MGNPLTDERIAGGRDVIRTAASSELACGPINRGSAEKVVELRFFGGLSVEETAEVLCVSPITVMREWKSAKAWLYRELAGPTANGQ